ncbi:LytR/AlgR family response regulator transcription factor [Aquimarina mytili]|uniref:LytTR family transcriptional regulator n=1 Tax=Aquimarina mytili TaxID=874423 RepID=A0A937DB00_9FLAO|nr:LytTR family DNA-binding domain-containing protein [Aquimarina mytili]MBL0684073.1 LytTR family transcriptional regulator [Aquimarina mytili]
MAIWHKKDNKLFIVLIPIVNLVNYFITYKNITLNTYFFLTLFIDTIQGYMTWLIVRYVIIKMEKKSPLIDFTFKRLFLQLFYTSLAGLFFIIVTTELLNAIAKDKPVPLNFYQLDIWIYEIWILVINGIYISLYYYLFWKKSEQKLQTAKTLNSDGITVNIGNKSVRIALNDVCGFYVEEGVTFILDNTNKTYIINTSLDKLEQRLSSIQFFRVNRKFILHHSAVVAFNKIENKKLLVLTSPENNLPEELFISRLKAPKFKKWFKQNSVPL